MKIEAKFCAECGTFFVGQYIVDPAIRFGDGVATFCDDQTLPVEKRCYIKAKKRKSKTPLHRTAPKGDHSEVEDVLDAEKKLVTKSYVFERKDRTEAEHPGESHGDKTDDDWRYADLEDDEGE